MMVVLIILTAFVGFFLFLVKGRTGQKTLSVLRQHYYAHRGLHGQGVPENSLAAFRAAKAAGYGVELDVHLMKDGALSVVHDSSLKRMTGYDELIENLTSAELNDLRLLGTDEKIPLFSEVLHTLADTPLIVELKTNKNNYKQLCEKACNMLDCYDGVYCIESFDPRCIQWLRKNRKDIVRGQLTADFWKSESNKPWLLKFAMRHQLLNLFSRPDFVAYCFDDRRTVSSWVYRTLWRGQGVAWTLRTKMDFDTAVQEGWIPVFENFKP